MIAAPSVGTVAAAGLGTADTTIIDNTNALQWSIVPDGTVLRGWGNGQEQLEGRVEQGLRVGRWRTWYENGQSESAGEYREDRRQGEWRFWDAQGALVRHVRYAAGVAVEELPLPVARLTPPPVVADPQLLPFRPRLYDDGGTDIKLEFR